jgi:hypothetical protein
VPTQRLTPQFFEKQIAQLERDRNELDEEIAWWREGYERFMRKREPRRPDVTVVNRDGRPTLRAAIQIVMQESDQSHWRVGEILAALQARDWQPRGAQPQDAIGAMIASMKKKGEIFWVSRGVYALTPVQHEQLASPNGAASAADEVDA